MNSTYRKIIDNIGLEIQRAHDAMDAGKLYTAIIALRGAEGSFSTWRALAVFAYREDARPWQALLDDLQEAWTRFDQMLIERAMNRFHLHTDEPERLKEEP